ncbi:hypothetical protein BX666DRAFT_1996662 [Dichotomocladium elegans]|nr:hypothetical protein BX666DRAFT_1996662 [Dichotomocladium elegans]
MDIDNQAIADFCAFTGASTEVANQYLQATDGNVETAVTLFMESGGNSGGTGGIDRSATPSAPRSASTANVTDIDDAAGPLISDEELARQLEHEQRARQHSNRVRAPIAPKRDILAGGGRGSLFGPGEGSSIWGEGTRQSQLSVFNQGDSSSGGPDPAFLQRIASGSGSTTDYAMTVDAKIKRLADLFRPPFDIMYKGGFEDARTTAREQSKWLLINIQDPGEFTCQILNRDLWSDTTIKEIIRESFIFLQYAKESAEGKRYLTYYPIQKYPHIAAIDARTGERVHTWESVLTPSDFMMKVTEFLEQHSPESAAQSSIIKKQRMMKDFSDMSEEEQLNAAIAASLEEEAEEEEELQKEDEQPGVESEKREEKKDSAFDKIHAIKRDEPTDLANSTRIQFRLPDGKRVIRRFMKTDPVRYLFEYVKAEVANADAEDRPFELVFNRQQLIQILDQSIQDAGLANAAVNCVFP